MKFVSDHLTEQGLSNPNDIDMSIPLIPLLLDIGLRILSIKKLFQAYLIYYRLTVRNFMKTIKNY